MYLKFFFIFSVLLTLSGCNTDDISKQKEICLSQGKVFYIKQTLNLRTGEYEDKGYCK